MDQEKPFPFAVDIPIPPAGLGPMLPVLAGCGPGVIGYEPWPFRFDGRAELEPRRVGSNPVHYDRGRTMADDKTKTGMADRDRINIDEAYEFADWSKKFGVTHQQLLEAVQIVGNRAQDVERHLKAHD